MFKNLFTAPLIHLWLFVCIALLSMHNGLLAQKGTIKFVENKGQWPGNVRFVTDIPGGKMYLCRDGIKYTFPDPKAMGSRFHHLEEVESSPTGRNGDKKIEIQTFEVGFIDRSESLKIGGNDPGNEVFNYYIGKDQSKWAYGCRAFESVTYENLYPNIDLVFYTFHQKLKYDLVLKKGANPSDIQFEYSGADEVSLINSQIHTRTKFNNLVDARPFAYQLNKNGRKKRIDCNYKLRGNLLSFEFGKGFDRENELVIDPELIFSTFSGSLADNFGFTACFDDEGNLYSGGNVFGSGFPATNGTSFSGITTDIGILKYDSSGTQLMYGTYLGGASEEAPHSLVVNHNNELLIMGTTGSSDFPTTAGAYDTSFNGGTSFDVFGTYGQGSDIYVAKLGDDGELIASTYVGGPGNDGVLKLTSRTVDGYINELIRNYGDYLRGDIIMDQDDNIYVASSTDSLGFPVSSSIQSEYKGGNSDGVIFSLSSDLSTLLWSTYLGGSADDAMYSIKLDSHGNIYLGGGTTSEDFNSSFNSDGLNQDYSGLVDGVIVKLSQAGDSVIQSTFLGTSQYDQVFFIDLDENENVYAFGQTMGNYPVSEDVYSNTNGSQFIHKLDNSLQSTIFSTVFGSGSRQPNISPTAFLVNECDNIFLSGWGGQVNSGIRSVNNGNTFNMPITEDALFRNTDGSDFYLMSLSVDGKALLYGTYFGGFNTQTGDHVDGGTSRFDKRGIIYQSVCSCGGATDNFPTTPGAWSNVNRGVNSAGVPRCNNAAFKFDLATLKARIGTNTVLRDQQGINSGCIPLTIVFTNNSVGGQRFEWNFGDGTTSEEPIEVLHTYEEPGMYTVTLTAWDDNTCTKQDITFQTISVFENNFSISEPFQICEGEQVTLSASGSETYEWTTMSGTTISRESSVDVAPTQTSVYQVLAIDGNSCVFKDSVKVTVIPQKVMDFDVVYNNNCGQEPFLTFQNRSLDELDFLWDFGDGTTSESQSPNYKFSEFGTYNINLTAIGVDCVVDREKEVLYQDFFIPNVFTPNGDGKNDNFEIISYQQIDISIFDRNGVVVFSKANYRGNWNGSGLPAGVYYYDLSFPNGEVCNGWVHLLR